MKIILTFDFLTNKISLNSSDKSLSDTSSLSFNICANVYGSMLYFLFFSISSSSAVFLTNY